MHDGLAVSAELANPYWFYPKAVVHRQTCRHAQPTPTAPALFPCGDGRYVYFVLFVADLKPFRQLVDWMATKGVEADLLEPEYEDAAYRQENFGHIQGLVEVFFLLQTVFLVLNAVLTWALLPLGATYLGLGFLAASTISALIAYLALARTLYRLDYLTFIANNPAVRIRRRAAKAS